MRACGGGPDLYFQWEAASGGQALLGTETLAIRLFNAGYGLKKAVLEIDGLDASGREIFSIRQTAEELPRGREHRMEVPSYEVPSDPADLAVTLLSADLGEDA